MKDSLLQILTREGVLINVSVRYWRAHKKLRAEDIGLNTAEVSDRLISLGHKRLLPKEATAALALVESRAHALIESNTFPFLNGLAHFLPNTKLQEITDKLKELETEFWAAKAKFLEQYGALREAALKEWRAVAQKLSDNPDSVLANIEASFPPAGTLERSFGFDTRLFQISAPERLGLDMVSLGDQENLIAARQKAATEAAARIRAETERFVSDCVSSMREQTAKLCEEMLESIRTSETGVHQKTLNRLVKFIDQFKSLNFVGDQEMDSQLEQVRKELLSRSAQEDTATTRSPSSAWSRASIAWPMRHANSPNRTRLNWCNGLVNSAVGSSTWPHSTSLLTRISPGSVSKVRGASIWMIQSCPLNQSELLEAMRRSRLVEINLARADRPTLGSTPWPSLGYRATAAGLRGPGVRRALCGRSSQRRWPARQPRVPARASILLQLRSGRGWLASLLEQFRRSATPMRPSLQGRC